ncbi:acyl-CoA dehydrogenase family protein [Chachezhania sediminis]|uniref:acyl-CoA dehydrogenase family protein n=1 Tax=Chachezhania sediminis TaxID=2599291 RepID=UPI00131D8FEA|nr:acyl-CoA dehydrogenase family protein [Chachezhania sediminis]
MPDPVWMTPEMSYFRDSVRKFCERELLPNEPHWEAQQCVDPETWIKAGQAGLLCCGIPEEYGGGGGNFMHEAIAFSEQARALAPGLGNAVHSGIVAHYIHSFASEEQKQAWLPKMASGELVGALAMTEPDAGSDVQGIRTRAVKSGDEFVITGSKTYISNGTQAGLICVVAKTDPDAGAGGISIFAVEADKVVGLRRGQPLQKIGLHSQDTSELFFDDMRVPASALLGGVEGRGFYQLMAELARERVIAGLVAIACAERAIEETVTFTANRKVFGKPLIKMQNTRFVLADCATKLSMAQAFFAQCSQQLLDGHLDPAEAAKLKYFATDSCGQIVDACLQLHGGAGYMAEYPIAKLYQNVRIHRILAGSNEIMRELIARSLDPLGGSGR